MRIGRLAPLVLVAWALLDVGLRFTPPEWFHVNPITVALRRPTPHASFGPNLSLELQRPIGDAAREANLSATEPRLPMRFSTDEYGYRRNPFVRPGDVPDVMVLRGYSFVYGGALSDHETLPAVLTRVSGLHAYNAGRWHLDDDSLRDLDWLLAQWPQRPRLAVVVFLEHENPGEPPGGEGGVVEAAARVHPAMAGPAERARRAYRQLRRYQRTAVRWWEFSPLEILTRRLHRALSNDRVLPNTFKDAGRQLALPDGHFMMFRDYELAPARQPRTRPDAAQAVNYLAWWCERLRERGIQPVALLLPTRYTVYGPALETSAAARRQARDARSYLRRLGDELQSLGVPTVDATRIFAARVEEELRTGELSYFREDNHWTPAGVERVAHALADVLARVDDRRERLLTVNHLPIAARR